MCYYDGIKMAPNHVKTAQFQYAINFFSKMPAQTHPSPPSMITSRRSTILNKTKTANQIEVKIRLIFQNYLNEFNLTTI